MIETLGRSYGQYAGQGLCLYSIVDLIEHINVYFQSQRSWIEKTFMKRECSKFIRSSRDAGK